MTDDLKQSLSSWTAPPPSAAVRERIDTLFDDVSLRGPSATSKQGGALLPVVYGLVVGGLLLSTTWLSKGSAPVLKTHGVSSTAAVVVTPGLPATSQVTATAVSIVELQGYEPIQQPRIQIVRSGS